MRSGGSGRVDLCTPAWLLERAYHVLGRPVDLDPASNPATLVEARVHCVDPGRHELNPVLDPGYVAVDGLSFDWYAEGARTAWVNPPYGRSHNNKWAEKIRSEGEAGLSVLALVPAATSTAWFGNYWRAHRFAFLVGRVKHVGEPAGADFAQCVAGWNVPEVKFMQAFENVGRIVR